MTYLYIISEGENGEGSRPVYTFTNLKAALRQFESLKQGLYECDYICLHKLPFINQDVSNTSPIKKHP